MDESYSNDFITST